MPIKPFQLKNSQDSFETNVKSTSDKYINFTRKHKNSTEILFETVNDLDSDTVRFWMELEGRIQSRKINRTPEVIGVQS